MTRERNASELFTDLARETSVLVRQEVKLAQIEMTEKATYAAKQAGLVAAGGALAAIAPSFSFRRWFWDWVNSSRSGRRR